jgi:hypothetical protein
MPLGYDREQNIASLGDTATLTASLYDEADAPISDVDLLTVQFTIQKPDKTKLGPFDGTIEDGGIGTYKFADTTEVGQYVAIATFTTDLGDKQSVRVDFEVVDPFAQITPSASWFVADGAWRKIEDCFDGEDEGPWLRDMTLNYFNKNKMESFIDEALMDINLQNPPTGLDIGQFVSIDNQGNALATGDFPLLIQGVFICVLRHLIRSYVEQPQPQGAQIAWHDRRDYLERWQSVYQIEREQYMRILALYKRRFLDLGHAKGLITAKAGRLIPAPMRTRFIGRGFW